VAFPPPPVTFPATRLVQAPKSGERLALIWLIISKERCSFLSEQLEVFRRTLLASLSASAPDVLDGGFPLLPSSNDASPHPFHLPVPVKTPVAISTVKLSYTSKNQCQAENTLTYALILQ
jgi:hypothetical protein